MSDQRKGKLRLVKVLVQPMFAWDDGDTLCEIPASAIPGAEIPAADWPTYSGERFPREIVALQAKLDSGEIPVAAILPAPPVTPNRAARRRKPNPSPRKTRK